MNQQTQQVIAWMKQNGSNYAVWKSQDAAYKSLFANLPRFRKEHESLQEATVLYVGAEQSKFEQGEISIVVYLFDEASGCGDFWRGSMSNSYGQNNTKTRKEKTLEVLERCGISDIRNLYSLIGKKLPVWVQEKTSQNGNTYYPIVTIGSSGVEIQPPVSLESLFCGATTVVVPPAAQATAQAQPPTTTAATSSSAFVPGNNPF